MQTQTTWDRIKFQGENDADQEVLYAKISGKILDKTDGSEDGILEFAFKKNGSNNISGRFRSDSLQLLNDTSLRVTGHVELGVLASDPNTTTDIAHIYACLLYTSPSPRDVHLSRMPSSA